MIWLRIHEKTPGPLIRRRWCRLVQECIEHALMIDVAASMAHSTGSRQPPQPCLPSKDAGILAPESGDRL